MGGGVKPTLVLDTCALLDLVSERWNQENVKDSFLDSPNPALLSISVWEISRKFRIEKLRLPCEQHEILSFVRQVCEHFSISIQPVSEVICSEAECFPLYHRDPFDRMILATAKLANCPVVTTDRVFQQYGVSVLEHRR